MTDDKQARAAFIEAKGMILSHLYRRLDGETFSDLFRFVRRGLHYAQPDVQRAIYSALRWLVCNGAVIELIGKYRLSFDAWVEAVATA